MIEIHKNGAWGKHFGKFPYVHFSTGLNPFPFFNCSPIFMFFKLLVVSWHPIQAYKQTTQAHQNFLIFRLLVANHAIKASCSLVDLTFTWKNKQNATPTIARSPHKSLPQYAQDGKNVSG